MLLNKCFRLKKKHRRSLWSSTSTIRYPFLR